MPTARIVTTPRIETVQAEFVVPLPNEYDTVRSEEAVAPIDTDAVPKATFDGWAKVMFWFREPTLIVCVAVAAAVKFVVNAESASMTQLPVVRTLTTPPLIEHTADEEPRIVNTGVRPEEEPVTVLIDDAAGVYVPLGSGDAGTADVKLTTWPARAMVIVCTDDVVEL